MGAGWRMRQEESRRGDQSIDRYRLIEIVGYEVAGV